MEITKKELGQVYYLTREIRMYEQELKELEPEAKSAQITGMPAAKTNVPKRPTEEKAIDLGELATIIELLKFQCEEKKKEIYQMIQSVEDSQLRQIIVLRCIKLLSWKDVAKELGGPNNPEQCRQMYHRNIPAE